jgi:hypothetical protein
VGSIVAQVYVVDPDIGRIFDRDSVFICCSHVLVHRVTDDDVCHIQDGETNTNDLLTSSEDIPSNRDERNLLPLRPMIDLLDPTKIFLAPEMVPETTTIRGSSPVTALSSASRVDTVTVVPPLPPEVLQFVSKFMI